jgi:hypothetical protein
MWVAEQQRPLWVISGHFATRSDVRFTPKADMCSAGRCPLGANSGHYAFRVGWVVELSALPHLRVTSLANNVAG